MSTELLNRTNASQQMYLRAISSAYRNSLQLYEPSVWLPTEPEIEDKMLRDSDILQATDYRCKLVAGRQWTLQAENEGDAQSALAVKVGTSLLKKLKRFTQARYKLARAFLHGQRIGKIHGRTMVLTIGDGKARTWWVPTHIEDVDKRWYRTVPKLEGGQLSAHYQRWNIAKGDWEDESTEDAVCTIRHTYLDEQGNLGFGRGLREALGWLWHTKTNVWHDYTRAAARFGNGVSVTKVDGLRDGESGLPNEELMRAYLEARANMRANHDIVIDRNDELEIVSPGGEGWQMFRELTGAIKTSIIALILSANLTTSADSGGSYALGEIQENSTEALVQFDRESLEETLTDSVVGAMWSKNRWNLLELGIEEEQPRLNIKQEKRVDPEKRANVAEKAHNMGLPLAKEDLYEQLGFKKPQDDDDVLEGADPMAAAGGLGQPGGGDPLDVFRLGPPKGAAPPTAPGEQDDDEGDDAPPRERDDA